MSTCKHGYVSDESIAKRRVCSVCGVNIGGCKRRDAHPLANPENVRLTSDLSTSGTCNSRARALRTYCRVSLARDASDESSTLIGREPDGRQPAALRYWPTTRRYHCLYLRASIAHRWAREKNCDNAKWWDTFASIGQTHLWREFDANGVVQRCGCGLLYEWAIIAGVESGKERPTLLSIINVSRKAKRPLVCTRRKSANSTNAKETQKNLEFKFRSKRNFELT